MPHPGPPPERHPLGRAGDHWLRLGEHVPADLFEPESWPRLAKAASVLPGPAFLLERTLASPRVIQFGGHIWPWRMDTVLADAPRHPHAAFLADHVRAWRASQGGHRPYLHLMAMWDEPEGIAPPAPQVFLAPYPGEPGWRSAVRAFADRLDAAAVAEAWRRCAATPHDGVVALGVYRGPRHLPTRVTVSSRADRQWPGHPNWAAVAEIVALSRGVTPAIAVAPEADPGPVWHVPAIVSRHPRPHEALAPLVEALRRRGLVDADTARALCRPPLSISLPGPATLEGQPALLRLLLSLERIKIVVEDGQWRSAKACYLVRPVWRTAAGRVVVEE